MDWQPIETAPKDGKTYFIGFAGKMAISCVWDDDDQKFVTWNYWYERDIGKDFNPTCWMPLPPTDQPSER